MLTRFFLFGRSLAKGLGRSFRSYLFARDLSKRITASITNAAPRNDRANGSKPTLFKHF
jgi:hypothetical protein